MADEPGDDLVSIDDPSVDVAALMSEIRTTVERKRREGVYSPEFLALLERPLDIEPDPAYVAGPVWQEVLRSTEVRAEGDLRSARPYVGPAVSAAKQSVQRALRWYLPPVIDQINAHHRAVVDVLDEHNRQIAELQREVARLRQLLGGEATGPAS